MNKTSVDILLITHNRSKYLKQTITSILSQTYHDYNLIILDNCSTDDTKSVVDGFNDNRITYYRHKQNIGGIGNLDFAFKYSNSKYFVIFHDDDIMLPTFIETEYKTMESNQEISAVSCNVHMINDKTTIEECKKYESNIHGVISEYSKEKMFETYICKRKALFFPTIMYRTSFIRNNNISIKPLAGPSTDVVLAFDIERAGGLIAELSDKLVCYRNHPGQDSQNSRVKMIVQLFSYLYNDSYYSNLLLKYSRYLDKYCNRLLFNEICLFSDEKIDTKDLTDDMNSYIEAIKVSRLEIIKIRASIAACRLFPVLIKTGYCLCKRFKNRR